MDQLEGNMRVDASALESGRLLFFATLDEPVRETMLRDLRSICGKFLYVLKPSHLGTTPTQNHNAGLKQWDLWGPLLLCLFLSVVLYMQASFSLPGAPPATTELSSSDQKLRTDATTAAFPTTIELAKQRKERQRVAFTLVYVVVALGASIVTFNAKLLGSNISFFQSFCVLGYCLCPLVLAAFVNLFMARSVALLKLLLAFVALRWSGRASVSFMSEVVSEEKRALAVYPIWLFYTAVAWIICSA